MSQNQSPMIPRQKNHSEWTQKALCRGYPTDLWFPEVPQGRDYFAHAREICNQCSVKKDCLNFALTFSADEDKFGMFGGLSPKERLEIRNRNNKYVEPKTHNCNKKSNEPPSPPDQRPNGNKTAKYLHGGVVDRLHNRSSKSCNKKDKDTNGKEKRT